MEVYVSFNMHSCFLFFRMKLKEKILLLCELLKEVVRVKLKQQ